MQEKCLATEQTEWLPAPVLPTTTGRRNEDAGIRLAWSVVMLVLVLTAQPVTQLVCFGSQIELVMRVFAHPQRFSFADLDAKILHGINLARIICHQAQRVDTQMIQHRLANGVVSQIRGKAQLLVGLDRISTAILQAICPDFV